MKQKSTKAPLAESSQSEYFRVREIAIDDEPVETLSDFDDHVQAELACDVYNFEKKVVIVAPIAGAKMEDLKVKVAEDVITIKGQRRNPVDGSEEDVHTAECFWGEFSRSIILPPNVDTGKVKASFKNAVLLIEIPKIQSPKERVIKIVSG